MPKRTSLPSMFAAGVVGVETCWSTPCSNGLPRASAQYAAVTPHKNRIAIADHTAQPWRCDPVIRPQRVSQTGRDRKDRKHLQEVTKWRGILNGWELLALKNPPPFVPSILIAS